MFPKKPAAIFAALCIAASVFTCANAQSDYRGYISSSQLSPSKAGVSQNIDNAETLSAGEFFSLSASVPEDGLYNFTLKYICAGTQDVLICLEIDGAVPFSQAERLNFPCFWENESDEWKTSADQFTPEQKPYGGEVSSPACDRSGENETPYAFALTAGEHTFTAKIISGGLIPLGITLSPPSGVNPYKAPTDAEKLDINPIIIEGEDAFLKNSRSLIPLSDGASPYITPCDPAHNKLNYIGGSNWSGAGQTIYWKAEIEKSGWYSIAFRFRQSLSVGSVAYRSLQIDGVTPFSEALRVPFEYRSSWQDTTFGGQEPYYIYLEKGEHIISLTATAGALSDLYYSCRDTVSDMSDLYVDITKVVGETVDIYRSYELFNQIPDFNKKLDDITEKLENVADTMQKMQSNKTGSSVSTVRDAVRVVRRMRDNPYSAHKYKSQFYNAFTNLSSLLTDLANRPLDIDKIVLFGFGSQEDIEKPSFSEKFGFGLKRFLITFGDDYNVVSSESNADVMNIWVSWGRDQAEALGSIIRDDFVKKTGIPVKLSLNNASLINAILAGSGPDCLIQMSRTEPVNLAMRGALVDISQFADFPEVCERFTPDATLPYKYKNGVYALPVTQGFYLMFLRTDILDNLKIKTPETWDDFLNAASILQRSNLQAVIPYTQLADSGTVNTGVGGLSLYPTLLLQRGQQIYNKSETATALAETAEVQTFVYWTEFYTKYKFQEITNFYNRFRIGSAPLGIAPYTLYTELKAAAPEIDGRWTVSLIPGTQTGGEINHISASWGSGCGITKLSKNPENAWEFLKWWTSSDVQLRYSNRLESVLGPLGRVNTANLSAFSQMDWDAQMIEVLKEQFANTKEIPELPGGYYTARAVDQAFWNVVETGKEPAETIKKWSAEADDEIARKKAEYEN